MKKLFSTKYSGTSFNLSMLILRLGVGLTLAFWHGMDKMMHFASYQSRFINFLGLGSKISLALVIFAEFFCALLLVLGLFTRLATIPIIITMLVAIFMVHMPHGGLKEGADALLYLLPTCVILLCGAGKISVDGMIGK